MQDTAQGVPMKANLKRSTKCTFLSLSVCLVGSSALRYHWPRDEMTASMATESLEMKKKLETNVFSAVLQEGKPRPSRKSARQSHGKTSCAVVHFTGVQGERKTARAAKIVIPRNVISALPVAAYFVDSL